MKTNSKTNSKPTISVGLMPLNERANGNFHGGRSSSAGQESLEGDDIAPVSENLNSDTSEDEFPELDMEGQDNDQGESLPIAEQSTASTLRKRRRSHRHTKHQIKEMESFYKRYPRPNKNQRQELASALGLDPMQVKFWFQNRRTQMKAQHDRKENSRLRAENEKLFLENMKMKKNTFAIPCKNCGSPRTITMSSEQRLLSLENARLKQEVERVVAVAKNALGNINGYSSACSFSPSLLGAYGVVPAKIPPQNVVYRNQPVRPPNGPGELNKSLITELAVLAMKEVTAMARIGEPLWTLNRGQDSTVLNEQEYFKIFRKGFSPKSLEFKSEASRECAIVLMKSANIPEIFMELSKWLALFSGMVSRAMLLDVLSNGVVGSYDGAMQVMTAEFQVLSPVVPTRECVFVRYCTQLSEGTWAIVDVSVDALLCKGLAPAARCQRRPSGCIIQEMPNGYSKITWVEHVEVQDQVIHNLSKSIISSGYAYGAKRWISILERQGERIASATGLTNYSYYGYLNGIALTSPEGRQSILKLAERMVLSFCGGVTAPFSDYPWTIISGDGFNEVRIMTRKSIDDPGRPGGVVLSASICFWIPVLPKNVLDYLRNEKSRAEWDVLTNGGSVQEMASIRNGKEIGNCVTVLRVTNRHSNQSNMLILQESSSEPTTSFIVYAPVDVISISTLFRGGNSDDVQLLPSGFTILPSGPPDHGGRINQDASTVDGTLLTVSFQILVDAGPNAKLSVEPVAMVNNLIDSTTRKIKTAFGLD